MQKILSILSCLLVTINSQKVCVEKFDETVCENFTLTPETVLTSTTKKISIKNADGVILNESLSSLKNVTEIEITGSSIKAIEPGALCCVPKLILINFKGNKQLPVIKQETLDDCQDLKKLYLSGGNLEISNGAFDQLKNLHTLSLDGGDFTQAFDKSTFKGLENLRYLTVRNSKIQILKKGVFDNLSNLKSLDLQSNQIEIIEPGVLGSLSQLSVLNLSDNKIKDLSWDEFEGLKAVKVLFLERNEFGDVDVDKMVKTMPNLERIFLSWDKLKPQSRKQIEETLPKLNITVIYSGVPV